MTRLQRLQLRQSEIRQRLAELLDTETRSEEEDNELDSLTREARSIETDVRAAMVLEAQEEREHRIETNVEDLTPEGREREELRSRFSIGRLLAARIRGTQPGGVEAEYAAAMGGTAGQCFTEIFETRAVTPGVEGGTEQRPIVPALFDMSVAPYLGIAMTTVSSGDVAFPILATSLTADTAAKGSQVPQTAGAFTVSSVQPRRLGASFQVQYEDLARLEGMEQSLRMNLQETMTNALDDHVINGDDDSGDGKVQGLLPQLTDPTEPAANPETWERFNVAFVSAIDGLHAYDETAVRALVGVGTYRHMAGQFRAAESNESFSAYWRRTGGGVRATKKIAPPASNIQQAIIVRNNPAGDSPATMAHWSSFDMTVRDVFSNARAGEVTITASVLVSDVVLLRSGVYLQDSFRLA